MSRIVNQVLDRVCEDVWQQVDYEVSRQAIDQIREGLGVRIWFLVYDQILRELNED